MLDALQLVNPPIPFDDNSVIEDHQSRQLRAVPRDYNMPVNRVKPIRTVKGKPRTIMPQI
jgi:hypothetical protein